jgi:hypothetical protein
MPLAHPNRREPLVLKNLDDYRAWPVKHRHWEFEVVESSTHEIWVSTKDLRTFYDALPSDKLLKGTYYRTMLYVKSTKDYYLSERSMRMELRRGKSHPQNVDILKFLDWFERNVTQVAVKKRTNARLDDANTFRQDQAQKIVVGPSPASLAPPRLDEATVPFTKEERWAIERDSDDIQKVYHADARPIRTTWKDWGHGHLRQRLDYVASFWRGERNLFLTFCVCLLLATVPNLFLRVLLPEALDWTEHYRRLMWASALIVPVVALWAIVFLVSMTRSTYRAWSAPAGKLWATTFYLLVLPVVPWIYFSHYDSEMLEYWWASVRGKYEPIAVYADPHLGRIVVRGAMKFGSAEALQLALDKNPKYTLIQIESPGGFVIEGMRMAQMVEKRKLDMVSLDECASACTLVLAAGGDRYLGPDVEVGFHRSGTRYGPIQSGWSETDHKIAEYYRSRGTNNAFIEKALTPSIRQIWIAAHADMYEAGFANLKWAERKVGY